MASKKIQLYTDRDKTIEASPETSANCVILSDGNDLQKVLDNDLTSPTVVHEETSFKVGVGDIDVSSSVVDGEVGRMVIKGQTYQNILPEPSTHVLSNNKQMFKVNEGLDSNVEIVDAVSKSAILSGNTLVNIDSCYTDNDFILFNNATIDSDGWITITANGNYLNACPKMNNLIKPSTKYLAIIEVKENTLDGKFMPFTKWGEDTCFTTNFQDMNNSNSWVINAKAKGVFKSFLLTKDDYANANVLERSYVDVACTTGSITYRTMLIEYQQGMETWDIPFFRGMQSVKLPVLRTVGSNLINSVLSSSWNSEVCNYEKLTNGYVLDNTIGRISYCRNLENLIVGRQYTFSCDIEFLQESSNNKIQVYLNSQGKGMYGSSRSTNGAITWTFTYDKKYESFGIYFQQDGDVEHLRANITNARINSGGTALTYEPHKTNILSCQLAPLNQSMFEQGTFAESTPPNTQSYEGIKLGSEHLYTTRIRTKGTYKVVKGATYSGQLNNGYGIFICYCKNGLYSAKDKGWIDETNFTFTVPNDCDEMFFALRKTDNSAITPSDYSHIGLKIHQEVVLRSLPNGVCDTLNLNTGEYVQKIGEVVLDGTQGFTQDVTSGDFKRFTLHSSFVSNMKVRGAIMCDKFVQIPDANATQEGIATGGSENYRLMLWVESSRLSTPDVAGLQAWLQQNPVTVQYELTTPVVKTVDLSSSGNWEKVVLDGSDDEGWGKTESTNSNTKSLWFMPDTEQLKGGAIFCDKLPTTTSGNSIGVRNSKSGGIYIHIDKMETLGVREWVAKNSPLTIWYQTTTHQDSTQVKQPIFFKDGHIQLSSGADNSLIPTLDYQAKTSNSYVMDLMKANTRYTMKAKSASGNFTLGGSSYSLGTNRVFSTTGAEFNANNMMVITGSYEDLMILEGELTSKTIPYFKGIKSAFEGESKIEVLSTGKNLFDGAFEKGIIDANGNLGYVPTAIRTVNYISVKPNASYHINLLNLEPFESLRVLYVHEYDENFKVLGETQVDNRNIYTSKSVTKFIKINTHNAHDLPVDSKMIVCENSTLDKQYEPYKSNSAKIPLLSPLRSLPDGTCDELIIDRMKKKATLIQRVGYVKFDNMDKLSFGDDAGNQYLYLATDRHIYFANRMELSNAPAIFSHFAYYTDGSLGKKDRGDYAAASNVVFCWCMPTKRDKKERESHLRNLAKQDGVIVQYQLNTPVVTEIDLEGFPLVYKDGHIFLNSEIAPVVEIDYNINQSQQIQSNNETLQRHELDILDLDNLIVSFVNAEYSLRLLKFNMELSMMALAE